MVYLLLAISLFGLSCKKEDDSSFSKSDLVGTWKMVKVGYDNNKNDVPNADELKETDRGYGNQVMVLNSDFTGSLFYEQEDTNGSLIPISRTFVWAMGYNQIRISERSGKYQEYTLLFHSMSAKELVRKEVTGYDPLPVNGWFVYQKQ